jgi:hypothetical protein
MKKFRVSPQARLRDWKVLLLPAEAHIFHTFIQDLCSLLSYERIGKRFEHSPKLHVLQFSYIFRAKIRASLNLPLELTHKRTISGL